ncbi:MAG TPA: ABC transporter ATP-binding protein [Egicoccus sp.]|nr:ABC transporter ATP-binding protein [Egicoccus sp.]HSK22435.1 ABC transporter ATP-binding protein [Egicoccus sp.]
MSLRVAAGEVVGLIGANGAGKTTLIRMLLGLVDPSGGHVRLVGRRPDRDARRRIGYVPQGKGLWPDLTLREHLDLSAAVHGHARVTLDDPELRAVADEVTARLSLGLRRRAAFVVATAHRPDVLLLDEPTSGMDPLGRAELWDLIRAAADAGSGVLVSTHYLDEARRCDRIVLLARGRVAAEGRVADVVGGRTAIEVRTEQWQAAWHRLDTVAGVGLLPMGRVLRVSGADVARVADIVVGLDAEVREVPATLEEVFLAVTS